MRNFRKDFIPEGWLHDYLNTFEGATCPPLALHAFSAISTLGAAFARKVRLLRGRQHPIDTTQSAVLVAPSGTGKGVAMDCARRVVGSAIPMFKVVGGKATMEGILSNLDPTYAKGLVVADELGALFGQQKFRANLDQELTDLLDNKDTYLWHTKSNKGEDHEGTFHNVAVTFLAGTTKQWMARCMSGTALEEGFASRVLWVLCVEDPFRVEYVDRVKEEELLTRELADYWNLWADDVALIRDAPKEFDRWMDQHWEKMPEDPWNRGWWNRKPTMLLQLALVLSISVNIKVRKRTTFIYPDCIKWASQLLEWNEPGMDELLTTIGAGQGSQKLRKILSRLGEYDDGISETDLNVRVWHITEGKKGLVEALGQLKEMGWVQSTSKWTTTPSGRKSYRVFWSITDEGKAVL